MNDVVKSLPSMLVSLAVHFVIFVVLILIPAALAPIAPEIDLESIFTEEPENEILNRDVELETDPAETLNFQAGGTLATTAGVSSQPAAAPVNIQQAKVMQEVNISPRVEMVGLPTDISAIQQIGEGEVTGEIGAMVEGYGAAMGIITQELIGLMRENKVTVLWLFDESESLVDDRKEIRENFLRIYEELGIATSQDEDLKKRKEDLLLTMIYSYGQGLTSHTPRPLADAEAVKKAIDKVGVDATGKENMCQSIQKAIADNIAATRGGRRKLVLIVVSDESGDDGEYVEQAVMAAKQAKSRVYFMGRESTFGYPYARQRWVHEPTGEEFWLSIRRGPETAFCECLQWNGIHARWDVDNAGFGPYEQVRIARESGGIYFVLPGEEETLVGEGANERRKYDFLAMREYQPLLLSRQEYLQQMAASKFRSTIAEVIVRLNPQENKLLFQKFDRELNIGNEHYPLELAAFAKRAAGEAEKAAKAMSLTSEAIALLEDVRPLRAGEASQRWRAAYDLELAQLYVFRLRLYQFLLAVDHHANNLKPPMNPESNEWNFWWSRQQIIPDEEQYKRLQTSFGLTWTRDEFLEMSKTEETAAVDRLKKVIADHPNTPWARRAQREIDSGFGFRVGERNWDPKGVRSTIKLPSL
ncbi:MAG: VWA domain-containing protein [Planctomycetaceae bacterium]|nr:VWA domain-containing protein [Planctomycetaceae bacterium]